ncbi:MAG TPA: diadenylate cyclase CdaA [Bryobacteraceae bacterium]|jgi:diadenylate cyclase|nr:diadenylate cyclase CdaA [Bryobacteraceae bacterium]
MARLIPHLFSLPGLTVAGIVDILLVAFLVYQALMVVRGTRAGHILLGIMMMVGLYGVAVAFGLEALRSLLSFIVPYLGLAIIVLFQSEIRRTLARIGRKSWVGAGFRAPEAIHEIVLAVEELAAQKTGALIVMERDIGLRTFVESGVHMEAQISRDLLLSIFQPGLPLHDGAAIIQKDRIAAAACFLPLTTNPSLSRNLGTRHRAAIGITEETDCLSVVVSEETGRISVAAFGELVSGLSLDELVDKINQHFGLQRPVRAEAPGIPHEPEPAALIGDSRALEKPNQEKIGREKVNQP